MINGLILSIIALFVALQAPNTPEPSPSDVPPDAVRYWNWTQEEWTSPKTDTMMRAARLKLVALYTDDTSHSDVVADLKRASQQSPEDRLKLFKWGYAYYLELGFGPPQSRDMQLFMTMGQVKPPYSYEFMRMEFLLELESGVSNHFVMLLGERLLKANPNDYEVLRLLSRNLRTDIPDQRRKAFLYARRLIDLDPQRAAGYAAMGAIYYDMWILSATKDVEAARQGVHWLQEYIRRKKLPADAKNIEQVRQIIQRLQKSISDSHPGA